MQYNRLGRSGLKVSELSYGSWVTFGKQLDVAGARACMRAAFEAGVNLGWPCTATSLNTSTERAFRTLPFGCLLSLF